MTGLYRKLNHIRQGINFSLKASIVDVPFIIMFEHQDFPGIYKMIMYLNI